MVNESGPGRNEPAQLLVTTALEETWDGDRPMVFLGDWCRLYDRKGVWEKRQYRVVRNHWDDRTKLKIDHDYLKGLHDSLLAELRRAMNGCHGIDRPLRYWQMILDPWLVAYVAVVWDRWECLRLAFEEHGQFETFALEAIADHTPCFDYHDFLEKILGDAWNHQLFLEIISSNYAGKCSIAKIPAAMGGVTDLDGHASPRTPAWSIKQALARFLDGLLSRLSDRNRAVIFNAYFPPAALVRLNLSLGQWPRLYLEEFRWPLPLVDPRRSEARGSSRAGISLGFEPRNAFESFLLDRLVKDIPTAYLEGFAPLRARAVQIPMRPKAIFTANAHWGNELFKLWSAEQVHGGVKFVAMDHGGGIPPALSAMSFEEEIADIKATWAKPFHRKHRQMSPSKLAGFRVVSSRVSLAVIGAEQPRYVVRAEAAPRSSQILTNFDSVCELYRLLSENVQRQFLVRPYPYEKGWNMRQRFIDALGRERVSDESNYDRFLSSARVIVCTYPQTTFSDAMASGLPTVLLYPPDLWETIPQMAPLLDELKSARILFHGDSAAATHINSIWDDPDRWWNGREAVHARSEFKRQALDTDSDWLREWKLFIQEMVA